MSTKKNQSPLLYIHQTFNRAPSTTNMQEVYTNRREQELLEEELPLEEDSNNTISLAQKDLLHEDRAEKEQPEVNSPVKSERPGAKLPVKLEKSGAKLPVNSEQPEVKLPVKPEQLETKLPAKSEREEVNTPVKPQGKQRSPIKRVKPFKEMGLYERLDYLLNFPKVLPPVPCVFYTAEGNFQGYLTEYTDQHVTIRFHDQTIRTIPLEHMNNVVMIGIKR
ncbi:CotO family spore coat protein [Bacillus sp. USDA818B3_A]|uniref:CotO family spore coat protein n=1 Tax=Bacillus sp. USDA818B3_A TaxID=2698834 RepID=UPI00136AC680|nr:CotO family spore coat protein [Bacillus sp. USDA818B3_A]